MKRRRAPLVLSALALAGFGTAALGTACRDHADKGRAHPPVLKLLMPLGQKKAVLAVERKKTHTGYTRVLAPRSVEIARIKRGVVYRVRERIDAKRWRLAAQLLIDARPNGAWIRAQYGLGSKRVGAKTPRLLFPWPPKPGHPRKVRYAITDGRKARGSVTVLRYGFSRTVAGTVYRPCLEVREVLRFDRGGGIDLRSVYCVGFGRVEIESKRKKTGKEVSTTFDRSTGLGK